MTSSATPFRLDVPEEDVADLRARLMRTRWPDQAPGEAWAYGTDVAYLKGLVEYWAEGFDWRAEEAALNTFPQFRADIDGVDLHFLHVPGVGPKPTPLLLLHGWPGSVFEFLDILPRLTDPGRFGGDPADAFTVVAPSLPGYGLSFRPGQARFGVPEIAGTVAKLMRDVLGYARFGVQGGDWGSAIATRLAWDVPELLIGAHVNLMLAAPSEPDAFDDPTPEEKRYLEESKRWLAEETGYQWIQGTRPQTLAFGLSDSPAGLAGWIVEKFHAWSDNDGDPAQAIPRDRMLGNISLYWFTGAIGSSFWPYYARKHGAVAVPAGKTIGVPLGYAAFPREIRRPPRSAAAKVFTDIRRWTVMERGGHFAAMEQPEALAREVAAFFRGLR